jgi:hypothetical protein
MTDPGGRALDEVRVITLPPPQTAAVNRLLREESGWKVLDVRVIERRTSEGGAEPWVVYVLGHMRDGEEGQCSWD